MYHGKRFFQICLGICFIMLSWTAFSQDKIVFYNFKAKLDPQAVVLIDAIEVNGQLKQDMGIAGPTSASEYRCSFLDSTGQVIKSANYNTPFERDPANCPNGIFREGEICIRTQYDPNAVTLTIERVPDLDPGALYLVGSVDLSSLTYGSPTPHFTVNQILTNGPKADKINFVFMGDGYTQSQLTNFLSDAQRIMNSFFTISPFREFKSRFNVYAVSVISNQSGATLAGEPTPTPAHPLSSTVDNYFGSSFYLDCNIANERLLGPTKKDKVRRVLQNHVPEYDLGIIIVNSLVYGGSGGKPGGTSEDSFPTCSTSIIPDAAQILVHEVAHGFAGLADEYWAGYEFAFKAPNFTRNNIQDSIIWKQYLGYESIDVFPMYDELNNYTRWHKPATRCKMNNLDDPFCLVCRENIKIKMLNLLDINNLCGDINKDGVVNIIDALITAQLYVGMDPGPFDPCLADVDGNNSLTILDALQIAQYYVDIRPTLPECNECPPQELNSLQITGLNPHSRNKIGWGERVNVAFNYNIVGTGGARASVILWNDDVVVTGASYSSAPIITGQGSDFVYFSVNFIDAQADRIQVILWTTDFVTKLCEDFIDVDYTFEEDVLRIKSISPSESDILWGNQVNVIFEYYVNQTGGAVVDCLPLNNNVPISGTSMFSSPVFTGKGSYTGYFTVSNNTINANQVRVRLWDPAKTTLLDDHKINVDLRFKGNAFWVTSITPQSGSHIGSAQSVSVTFSYSIQDATGARFYFYLYRDGSAVPGYVPADHGIFTGAGSITLDLDVPSGPETSDHIMILMTDTTATTTFAERYMPVYYYFN